MLRSEASSNCEEDNSPTLLAFSTGLSLGDNTTGFSLTPEEVLQALTSEFNLFEEQALVYFAGFVVRKVLDKFHSSTCEKCKVFGMHAQSQPQDVPMTEFFVWLKKYDESSKLYLPSSEFSEYVRKVAQLSLFCYCNYLSSSKLLESSTQAALKFIWSPEFCSARVKEKTASLVIRTVFNYKLKWLNTNIQTTTLQSQKKLRKIMHQ